MNTNLTLEDAMRLKPGDRVAFSPDMNVPGIRDQVLGITGLTTGMGLQPDQTYAVKSIEMQRGTPVTAYHVGSNGIPYATVSIVPDNSPQNVVIELDNGKFAGYSWFKV